jgi:hypothetical protein
VRHRSRSNECDRRLLQNGIDGPHPRRNVGELEDGQSGGSASCRSRVISACMCCNVNLWAPRKTFRRTESQSGEGTAGLSGATRTAARRSRLRGEDRGPVAIPRPHQERDHIDECAHSRHGRDRGHTSLS